MSEGRAIVLGAVIGFIAALGSSAVTVATTMWKTRFVLKIVSLQIPTLAQPAVVNREGMHLSGHWWASIDVDVNGQHTLMVYEVAGEDQSAANPARNATVNINREVEIDRLRFDPAAVINVTVTMKPRWNDQDSSKEPVQEGILSFESIETARNLTNGQLAQTICPDVHATANSSVIKYLLERR